MYNVAPFKIILMEKNICMQMNHLRWKWKMMIINNETYNLY